MTSIRVLKLDLDGKVTWEYEGRLLRRAAHSLVLEAEFDKPDFPLLDTVLKRGDRFVETYFDDRWYNIFEIHDRDTSRFKGWYCNLSRPAQLSAATVSWVDLALDLWVWPDGRRALLDEDEFAALPLAPSERDQVRAGLRQLEQELDSRPAPD